jgi:hypothetical protein
VTVLSPVTIDTVALPQAQVAAPYAVTLVATGGTGVYGWSIAAGQLPGGLSLGNSSGVIAGTPLQAGTFAFSVRAQDVSNPTRAAIRDYTLTVARRRGTPQRP